MSIRSVLVPILPQDEPSPMLSAALQIARRFDGHLDALFIAPDSNESIAGLPALTRRDRIGVEDAEATARRLAAVASEARFEDWRAAAVPIGEAAHAGGLKTPTRWIEYAGPIERALPAHGRLADLIVLHYPTRHVQESDKMFTVATFATGRPVLLVRHEVPKDILRHILVAWNGGLESTRALAGAMPLLAAAGTVTIFTAPPPDGTPVVGPSVCEALASHGIHSQQIWAHRSDAAVGDALLRAASERGATMIVMGAQNHSRHLPSQFGGITRHVLHDGGLPVLMAH